MEMKYDLVNEIAERKSVRSFDGRPVDDVLLKRIMDYASTAPQLQVGQPARAGSISGGEGKNENLGTYGVISGARDFLVLVGGDDELSLMNAGFYFEHIILYCTALGLGTCWLGGTFDRRRFTAGMTLASDEHLLIVSPLGYGAAKKRVLEKIMRFSVGSARRKEMDRLFFYGDFKTPVSASDKYYRALENVRLAPSARNGQPWRAVILPDRVRFYVEGGSPKFVPVDMGIALCHFSLSVASMGMNGRFEVEQGVDGHATMRYMISWIPD